MRVRVTTEIECSQEHLWSFFEDPERVKLWVPGLLELEITSPPPHGPGSTYVMRVQEGRKVREYEGRKLVWEPPSRIEEELWGESLRSVRKMTASYRLIDLGRRTRLEYENDFEIRGAWKLLQPLLFLLGGAYCRKMLGALEREAEETDPG